VLYRRHGLQKKPGHLNKSRYKKLRPLLHELYICSATVQSVIDNATTK